MAENKTVNSPKRRHGHMWTVRGLGLGPTPPAEPSDFGFLIKALWESVLSNGNEGDDLSLVIMRVIVSC